MRAMICALAGGLACLAGACVTEPVKPDAPQDKQPWTLVDVSTPGSRIVDQGVPDVPASDPQDLTPGLSPDLFAKKRSMLPGNRIRHPDGSVELIYSVPNAGKLPEHFLGMIDRFCVAWVQPGDHLVEYTNSKEVADKVAPPQRAVFLEIIDYADDVWLAGVNWYDPKKGFGKFQGASFPGYGNVEGTRVTRAISARGHPDDIDELETFVENFLIDVDQIEIVARVVEARIDDLTDLGAITSITRVQDDNVLFRQFSSDFDNTTGAGGAFFLQGIQDETQFDSTLRMLRRRTGVKFRAEPRVVIRNGGTAALIKGDQVPVQNIVAIAPNGDTSTSIKYEQVGLQLRLSAFAVGRDAVFLHVGIDNGNILGFTQISGVTNPTISNRSARTAVILKQGETLAIGGLFTTSKEERVSKVPILGDIPLLGYLFRSEFDFEEVVEVTFLFTPTITRSRYDLQSGLTE